MNHLRTLGFDPLENLMFANLLLSILKLLALFLMTVDAERVLLPADFLIENQLEIEKLFS